MSVELRQALSSVSERDGLQHSGAAEAELRYTPVHTGVPRHISQLHVDVLQGGTRCCFSSQIFWTLSCPSARIFGPLKAQQLSSFPNALAPCVNSPRKHNNPIDTRHGTKYKKKKLK